MEPAHDREPNIAVYGAANDLNTLALPTKRDILQYYFWLKEQANPPNQVPYTIFTSNVTDALTLIWSKLNIQLIERKCRQ